MVTSAATSFGELLRRNRLGAAMTQEVLAERSGLSAKTISDLERLPDRLPRFDTVVLLADALGLHGTHRSHFVDTARPQHESAAPITGPVTQQAIFPRPLTPLVGRDSDVKSVIDLIKDGSHQLVTLVGTGGVGKTRLAIEAAELVRDSFDNGVVFVDLSPLRDPSLVLASIALRLDIDERDRLPLNERLRAALHAQSVLLVLDNFEHVAAARFDVLELLESCAGVTVLATSRAPLRVRAEREYRVKPLDIPPPDEDPETISLASSITMFRERAQAAGVNLAITAESAPVIAQICARLDGLPLAIELAAAWTRLLSPSALLSRLDQRLSLLVDGPHDLPTRQRTMSDTVAWSYGLLGDGEQRLFRWLSVFVGGCTTTSIEAILESAGTNVVSQLLALVEQSLIRMQPSSEKGDLGSRIVMLETLREFGLDRLEATGEASEARQRHATHYLELVETAGSAMSSPEALNWRQRLELEHDNLRSALRWSIEMGEGEIALRFTSALWRFWSERGHLNEGLGWMRQALAVADESETSAAASRAKTLAGAVILATEQCAYGAANDFCDEAMSIIRKTGARKDLPAVLNAQGKLRRERGDYLDSIESHSEALLVAESIGDRSPTAAALTGLAMSSLFAGRTQDATRFAEQSLIISREANEPRQLAEALLASASNDVHRGNNEVARLHASEALRLFEELDDGRQMANALWALGVAVQFLGDYDRARDLHERCLYLRRRNGDEHGSVQVLTSLGRIALQVGDTARARVLLDESLSIVEHFDDRWSMAMAFALLGHVELQSDGIERSRRLFAESLKLLESIENPLYEAWCIEGLVQILALRHQWDAAGRLSGARDSILAELGMEIPPAHPAGYESSKDLIKSQIGSDRAATLHACGQLLSHVEAREMVNLILAELRLAGEFDRA